jgi:hypothetical protein
LTAPQQPIARRLVQRSRVRGRGRVDSWLGCKLSGVRAHKRTRVH